MARTLGFLVAILAASQLVAGEFGFEKHERGVRVLLDGELFTDYVTADGPKPYLWPIIGPTGKPMTRAFPMRDVAGEDQDHPHHRSLWFTHGKVNGIDFWMEGKEAGRIVHRDFTEMTAGPQARLVAKDDWQSPDGQTVCTDERRLTFQTAAGARIIDFDITLTASHGPLVLGDTKEGSFGVRVPSPIDVERAGKKTGAEIVTSEGLRNEAAWGKPASWVDYHGQLDGDMLGIAILNHPESFRFPTCWHVRTYGLFAANPFGLHDFHGEDPKYDGTHHLAEGESITLRYRVIFHQGNHEEAKIADAFQAYAAGK